MPARLFPNRVRAISLWVGLLLILTGASLGGNLLQQRYIVEMRESDPEVRLANAEALMNQGNYTGAMTELSRAFARNPKHPRYFKVLGDWKFNRGEWAAAIEAYQEALTLGSQELGIKVNTLWALIELEKYKEAVGFGEACIESGASAPYFPRYIAEALVRDGRAVEAIPYLETALRNNKNDLYLMNRLASAYEKADKLEQAQSIRNTMRRIETRLEDRL